MQSAGFLYNYFLTDFSHQRIPTSQQSFDAEASVSSFDFRINFFKNVWFGFFVK